MSDVYLAPGLLHAAMAPCVITTVLGSCVSVCLWDRARKTGGMNHFLLPRAPSRERSTRHGDTAMELLLARMEVLGSAIDDLDARVYGGATTYGRGNHLAEENVAMAFRWLFARAVPVIEEDVLGNTPRRIHFDIASGTVNLKKVGS